MFDVLVNHVKFPLFAPGIGSKKVFLGLFGKKLKVEVTLSERSLLCKGQDFVDDLLKLMDLRADTVLREEENVVDIEG